MRSLGRRAFLSYPLIAQATTWTVPYSVNLLAWVRVLDRGHVEDSSAPCVSEDLFCDVTHDRNEAPEPKLRAMC